MRESLPHEILTKYAHVFEASEGMHRVANSAGPVNTPSLLFYRIYGVWNQFGFIDEIGNEIIKPQYQHANDFKEGLALVNTHDGKNQYIDKLGNIILTFTNYEDCYSFSNGLACIKLNGKYGFINKTGQVVIPVIFDYIMGIDEFSFGNLDFLAVSVGDKIGVIKIDGSFLVEPKYDNFEWQKSSGGMPQLTLFSSDSSTIIDHEGKISKN